MNYYNLGWRSPLELVQQPIDIMLDILIILLGFAHGYEEQFHFQFCINFQGSKKWGRERWPTRYNCSCESIDFLSLYMLLFRKLFFFHSSTEVLDFVLLSIIFLHHHSFPLPLLPSLTALFLCSCFLFSLI